MKRFRMTLDIAMTVLASLLMAYDDLLASAELAESHPGGKEKST